MNIHHCYTRRNLILAAVLAIGFASSGLAQASRAVLVDLNSKEVTYPGILPGGFNSRALGINEAGQVVGDFKTDKGWPPHAFITGPDGAGMTDLGALGGDFSTASGINNAGQVIGLSSTDNGQTVAFITGPDGAGMTDLGTLGEASVPYGINDAGQVVGQSWTKDGLTHAFITGPDGFGMTNLGSVMNSQSGFAYLEAIDINNHGQLAVVGGVVPEPEMYAMLLLGLGLIGFLVRGRATA